MNVPAGWPEEEEAVPIGGDKPMMDDKEPSQISLPKDNGGVGIDRNTASFLFRISIFFLFNTFCHGYFTNPHLNLLQSSIFHWICIFTQFF